MSCFSELDWSVRHAGLWLVLTGSRGHVRGSDWLEVRSGGKWCNEWSCPLNDTNLSTRNCCLKISNIKYWLSCSQSRVTAQHSARLLGVWTRVENNNFIIPGDLETLETIMDHDSMKNIVLETWSGNNLFSISKNKLILQSSLLMNLLIVFQSLLPFWFICTLLNRTEPWYLLMLIVLMTPNLNEWSWWFISKLNYI